MKYLKTFEGLTTSVVDKIKSDINDIFIELTDINFMIDITDNREKLQWLYKKDGGRYEIDITITKGIPRDGVRVFKDIQFVEIYDYVEMLKDYLKEYPVEVSYMIDGINYNEEEYVYYTKRRIDKNHPDISIFKIKIKLEDETSK